MTITNLSNDPILFKRLLKCLRQFKLDFWQGYFSRDGTSCTFPNILKKLSTANLVFIASYLRTGKIIKQMFP